jgi:membrane protein DedA with SNARE-associated domain
MTAEPRGGLQRTEIILFVGGIFAFAFLMLVFGSPLPNEVFLPVIGGWIVAGLTFVWWFDRYLARTAEQQRKDKKVTRIASKRRG